MKATGIIRRIDDLGRVVIPKEIRRTAGIKEGDPLEIFFDPETKTVGFTPYDVEGRRKFDAVAEQVRNDLYYSADYEQAKVFDEEYQKFIDALQEQGIL